ncbi:MAG: hypothetical protein QOE46_202 [Acidobacteriota bacterium]|nr:hypothetical protein [Acidobacteriota bacterium]
MNAPHDRRLINSRRRIIRTFPALAGRLRVIGVCALALCALGLAAAQSTHDEEATRKLWDTAFNAAGRKPRRPGRNPGRGNYRVATPRVSPAGVSGDSVVGVTVWRLRPSREADDGERMIVHEGSDAAAWIPERVPANAGLAEGDRVRLSIEAARTGYLYVIDREQYADGTLGEPYLIFPTTRTLGGDNQVKAGRLIDIPAQEDSPPFFTLRRSRADQVGELLSVIVTPAPLDELQIGAQAQRLSPERVARWEKAWERQTGRMELSDGAGKVWTKEEKEAGASGARLLKASAPNPQTLYYRPGVKPDEPLLIKVKLQYRRRGAPTTPRR